MTLSKVIRAPSLSISHLYNKITSQPSSFSPALSTLVQELAAKEKGSNATAISDEEYNHLMKEMVSYGNRTLKLVSEKAEKMGSEGVYDEEVLDLYDTLVWGFNSPFLWRLAETDIHTLYSNNVSAKHAEIGVGTGLFLSQPDIKCQTVSLMDLNPNSLNVCEKRILTSNTDASVTKSIVDITKKDSIISHRGQYDSVAANFLFHCLHGSKMHDKFYAFQNCASLLSTNGVFLGSTILGKEMSNDAERAGEISLNVLHSYNEWGIFGNLGDSLVDLENVLKELFREVELKRIGYCGVWTARGLK